MKKIFSLILLVAPQFLFATNALTLNLATGENVTDTIYTVTGPSSIETFEEDLFVTNNTDTAVKIRVRRRQITVNPNSTNYFCWFQCYSPAVNVDPTNNFIILQQNETNSENFHAYFKPQNTFGVNKIRYTFFNNVPGHLNDSAFVEIIFNITSVMPPDPIVLQIPNSDFITNTDVYVDAEIDTNGGYFSDMIYPLAITNNTNVIKQLIVKKREISLVEGSQNFFSWHATFNPTVMEDTAGFIMFPNTTINNEFKAIYRSNGTIGESVVQYIIYNKFDPNDSAYVNVHFNTIFSGLDKKDNNFFKINLAPNPASSNTILYFNNFANNFDSQLFIYDSFGAVADSYNISSTQNQQIIDVEKLTNGVYFCKLINNKKTSATLKLIVAK